MSMQNALLLLSECIIIVIGACCYDYQNALLLSGHISIVIMCCCCYQNALLLSSEHVVAVVGAFFHDHQYQIMTHLTLLITLCGKDDRTFLFHECVFCIVIVMQ